MALVPLRYPIERILVALRVFFNEALEVDIPDPDQRIDEALGWLWDEIDIADIVELLELHFGFESDEWQEFFEHDLCRPRTIRELAEFIQGQLTVVPLEPIGILGAPCLTAGIFRGLETVARQIRPRVTRFRPGTPIRERLDGEQLERFWGRLQFMSEYRLPPLRSRFAGPVAVGFFLTVLACLLGKAFDTMEIGVFALTTSISALLLVYLSRPSPLPEGIDTFGDLARALAANR